MPPQISFTQPADPIVPPPTSPIKSWRRWSLVIVIGLIVLTGLAYGANLFFTKTGTPKPSPSPSQAPAVSTNERSKVADQPLGTTQLDVTTMTATDGDITTLLVKALKVAGSIDLQGDLTVTGNGTFSGAVTAANFTGSGAGLTGVDAALLGGKSAAFYQQLGNLQGSLSDARLSANVALRGANNNFTATNTFSGPTNLNGTTTISSLLLGSPLGVSQGGTGLTSVVSQGVLYGTGGNNLAATAAPAGAGQCLISGATDVQWGSCSGGAAGVDSVDGLTGILTLANSSGVGTTITINDATTAAKGIAGFSAANFIVAAGNVNTVQNIATTAAPTFAGLTLTGALAVASGGTGAGSLASNGVVVGNGTSPLSAVTAAGAGLCLISNAGAPSFQACPGGGAVTSVNGQAGAVSVANATGSAGTITIQDASTAQKGIASFNATNFSASAGAINTIQDIATGSSPTFAGINTNSINPSAALTVGSTTKALTLQGSNTTLTATNGGSVAQFTFVAPTANVTYRLQTAAAGTYDVCTTAGNCVGTGGSVSTSGGSANVIPKYTSAAGIGPSLLTDNGTVVTVGGDLSVTGNLTLTNQLPVAQGGTGAVSLTADGLLLGNGTSPVSSLVAGGSGLCLISTAGAPSFQACPGGGAVTSVNSQSGAVSIANASGSGGTVTINDATTAAKGIASFNATNFSVTSGAVNTIQNINTGATPTFAGITASTVNTNTITPSAALTVGATGQTFTVQGNASSTITATNGANSTALSFQAATANVTYRFLTTAAGTYDVCTTAGNCTGVGGGVTTPGGTINTVAKFTAGGTIGDSIITDNGTTVGIGGTLAVNTITPSAGLTIGSTSQSLTLQGNGSAKLTATSGGFTNSLQFATPAASGKTITIPNATGTVAVSATGPLAIDAAGNLTCATCVTSGGGGGGVGAVDSLNSLTGALTVANATTSGGTTITINDATTAAKGIASFNATNFSVASGAVNTIQDIATTASPTFTALTAATVNTNTITPSAALTVGSAAQNLTLQGNGSTKLTATSGGFTNTLQFAAPAASGKTITIPNATGTIAVSATGPLAVDAAGNLTCATCVTSGGGGGGIGAVDSLDTLTGALTLANSSGVGTTITINDATTAAKGIASFNSTNFSVASGAVNTIQNINSTASPTFTAVNTNAITPSAALTVGASAQKFTLQGTSGTTNSNIVASGGGFTNTLSFATVSGSNKTIALPNATGVVAVSGSGAISVDILGNITASDATTAAKGIASFNSTNFSVASGAVNTIQNINTTATPTFGQLTLTTSLLTPLVDTASAVALNLGTTNATTINLNQNTTIATGKNLTVTNGTFSQTYSGTSDAAPLALSSTSGTQTNGFSVTRSGAGGTTTNALLVAQTGGTLTNGLSFSGTIGTDINRSSGILTMQGAGGINLLSSGGNIVIGTPGGDTVGTLLVLGTKTTSGDPTGTTGAMYYNANSKSFRCYQVDHWSDCMLSARSGYHRIFELGSTDVHEDDFSVYQINGGLGQPPSETSHPGIVQLNTLTSAVGYGYAGSQSDTMLRLGNGDYWQYDTEFRLPTGSALSTSGQRYNVLAGFTRQQDSFVGGEPTDGCYFKYSDNVNSGKWQGICGNNSTYSTCDTGNTAALNTWYHFTVIVNAAGTLADFRINGSSTCTISTNIPTGASRLTGYGTSIEKTAGTTDRDLDIDYEEIESQFGSAR